VYLTRITTSGLLAQRQRLFLLFLSRGYSTSRWDCSVPPIISYLQPSTNRFHFLAYYRPCSKPQPLEICRLHAPYGSSKLCSHSDLTHLPFVVIKRPRSTAGFSGNKYISLDMTASDIQLVKPLSLVKPPSSHLTYLEMVSSYLSSLANRGSKKNFT
jgi:hypothetical protein